jgi:hypothetical protein
MNTISILYANTLVSIVNFLKLKYQYFSSQVTICYDISNYIFYIQRSQVRLNEMGDWQWTFAAIKWQEVNDIPMEETRIFIMNHSYLVHDNYHNGWMCNEQTIVLKIHLISYIAFIQFEHYNSFHHSKMIHKYLHKIFLFSIRIDKQSLPYQFLFGLTKSSLYAISVWMLNSSVGIFFCYCW